MLHFSSFGHEKLPTKSPLNSAASGSIFSLSLSERSKFTLCTEFLGENANQFSPAVWLVECRLTRQLEPS